MVHAAARNACLKMHAKMQFNMYLKNAKSYWLVLFNQLGATGHVRIYSKSHIKKNYQIMN